MRIQGGATINPAAGLARSFQAQQAAVSPAPAQKDDAVELSRRYDRVTLSAGGASAEAELRGRLSQEVRASASSERVAALREQIHRGEYHPDPAAIARSMLLAGEAI